MSEGEPPPKPARLSHGLQVAFGFFLPIVSLAIAGLGLTVSGALLGRYSGVLTLLSGAAGAVLFLGGNALALRRKWDGVILGLVLFGALIALLVGACFFMLIRGGR